MRRLIVVLVAILLSDSAAFCMDGVIDGDAAVRTLLDIQKNIAEETLTLSEASDQVSALQAKIAFLDESEAASLMSATVSLLRDIRARAILSVCRGSDDLVCVIPANKIQ